jgi:hypothetical protein
MSDLDSSRAPEVVSPLPGRNLPELPSAPAQVSRELPKEEKEFKPLRIKSYQYITVERSMKYETDGTPVTLVPSTPEFVLTLKDGTVIIPHIDAKIYCTIDGKQTYIPIKTMIDSIETKGGHFLHYFYRGFIDINDTDKYTVLVPVIDRRPVFYAGQRRKTRNYKKKYSRKASSLSRKYKARR